MIRSIGARARLPRRLVLCLLALVVAGAGTAGWLLLRDDEPAAATPTTATASTQTFKQTVTASGTLEAATTDDLAFAVSGTVTKVWVEPGDAVRAGQKLASVDDDVLEAQRDAAQSALDAAESARSENLSAGASEAQTSADKASVTAAESSLEQAQEALDGAVLRATSAGTVTAVGIEVGDRVSSSGGTGGAGSSVPTGSSDTSGSSGTTSTITVVSTGSFVVAATVASDDVSRLKKGLQAELTVSGIDDTVFGTVSEVGLVAEIDSSGAAAFPVTITVTGQRDDLYAGTSAAVTIIVSQRADVLAVDSRAIQSDGDATWVEKVDSDGSTTRVDVTTGETSGLATEILTGLADGDVVQVPGFSGPGGNGGDEQMQQMRERMQQGNFPGSPPEGFEPPAGGFPGRGGQ